MSGITVTIEESRLKELLKQSLLEIALERKELFRELFIEVLEEVGLIEAIKEGIDSEPVSRDEVFAILG